jgi:hypothetical protein
VGQKASRWESAQASGLVCSKASGWESAQASGPEWGKASARESALALGPEWDEASTAPEFRKLQWLCICILNQCSGLPLPVRTKYRFYHRDLEHYFPRQNSCIQPMFDDI